MIQFGFKQQLEVGQAGEAEFLERYPAKLTIHPDRDGDFIHPDGRKLELKTDTYSMQKTPNFFIERWSVLHQQKPGSLWQALEHGCSIFCYYFVRDNTYFQITNLPAAIELIENYITEQKPGMIHVKNRGYITGGYKIPRVLLEGLTEEFHWDD